MNIITDLISGYPSGDVSGQDFVDHLSIGAPGWQGAWLAIALAAPKNVIGTNTRDSMLSGIVYGTAGAIDRIIDSFPSTQQAQIRMQLSMSLQAVVCQQLLPHMSGRGRVVATEVMIANYAIRNLIREGKTPQISNAIATSGAEGSHLMDSSLISLFKQRKITSDTAIRAAHDREYVRRSTLF